MGVLGGTPDKKIYNNKITRIAGVVFVVVRLQNSLENSVALFMK